MKDTPNPLISLLIPTRGRTQALMTSIHSLCDLVSDPARIELLLAFDSDDELGKNYFVDHLARDLTERGVSYTALEFSPMGYVKLNEYYNGLAKISRGSWLMAWSDDAIMRTADWDQRITEHSGRFCLLKVRAHREHPYSIFPVWPREWYDLFGFVSRHQMVDAELSQIAYMLDVMQKIDVEVTHDRFDLTGNNLDATQINKKLLEGNPSDPRDFHHPDMVRERIRNCEIIAQYLSSCGQDITWWEKVKTGEQYPWEKLQANDVNKQTKQGQYSTK